MELQDEVYEQIVELCSQGDELVNNGEFEEAIELYSNALDLIPEPKIIWEASTWVYTALRDTHFFIENYEVAMNFLYDALNCPDGMGNPFILLRLGECLYELGEVSKSKEYLLRAYVLEGYSIFQSEDDKYFQVIINEI
ncbi:tol-pal system YbgF family protein [Bacillus sp. FJAT-27445]|uniref:tetratricopeptide repeat protein n=1 Tax=Bacillus sp. FJAT-27445 TaxID=1679166 RepID=UPI000743B0F4|nr:hypothetical protein [Bacillus sp. FJAT-27445]